MAKVSVGSRSRSAVQESDADPQSVYAAALLRLALRLKRSGPAGRPNWDQLVEKALGRSPHGQLDRPAFRGYLKRNYSFLLASLGQKNS
jgi:hypothetical protein